MRTQCKPNFFLVGGPKSGTTAMYRYLASHPEIGMSRDKEPHFFAADIEQHQRHSVTLPHYLRNFERAAGKKRIGEASTSYLASPRAAQEIFDFYPAARIIVILRNPIDVMHALFSQRRLTGREHISRFESAVDSTVTRYWQSGRFRGEPILQLTYREATRFSEQVARYLLRFGREHVHIVLFDDFARAPRVEYEKVLSFLELPLDGRRDFEKVNGNKRMRSELLQKRLRQLSRKFWRVERSFPVLCEGLRGIMARINFVSEPRPDMDPDFRRRLAMEYAPEIRNLERLLDRSLDHWLDRPRAGPTESAPPKLPAVDVRNAFLSVGDGATGVINASPYSTVTR